MLYTEAKKDNNKIVLEWLIQNNLNHDIEQNQIEYNDEDEDENEDKENSILAVVLIIIITIIYYIYNG